LAFSGRTTPGLTPGHDTPIARVFIDTLKPGARPRVDIQAVVVAAARLRLSIQVSWSKASQPISS
jgi:hypothetical protein